MALSSEAVVASLAVLFFTVVRSVRSRSLARRRHNNLLRPRLTLRVALFPRPFVGSFGVRPVKRCRVAGACGPCTSAFAWRTAGAELPPRQALGLEVVGGVPATSLDRLTAVNTKRSPRFPRARSRRHAAQELGNELRRLRGPGRLHRAARPVGHKDRPAYLTPTAPTASFRAWLTDPNSRAIELVQSRPGHAAA